MQLLSVIKVEWSDSSFILFAEHGLQDFDNLQLLESSETRVYGRPQPVNSQKRGIYFKNDPDNFFESIRQFKSEVQHCLKSDYRILQKEYDSQEIFEVYD
jgi:hypothetical protein